MKLIIYCPPAKQADIDVDHPIEISQFEFPAWAQDDFEFYGQAWGKWFPDDIVMLVEEEECANAGAS